MNIKEFNFKEFFGKRSVKIGIIAFILILSFFISFVLAIVAENKNDRLVLSFPHAREEGVLVSRERIAANGHSRLEKVQELVKQLGLGPNEELRDKCFGIFPLGLKAESVLIQGDEVFIQLPKDFILHEADYRYTIDRSVKVLEYNLKHNFNWISGLIVTVDGVELLNWHEKSEIGTDSEAEDENPEPVEELK